MSEDSNSIDINRLYINSLVFLTSHWFISQLIYFQYDIIFWHHIFKAISRNGSGVASNAILDAVRNPKNVVDMSNGVIKYIGDNATVILNKTGEVVTVWGSPRF